RDRSSILLSQLAEAVRRRLVPPADRRGNCIFHADVAWRPAVDREGARRDARNRRCLPGKSITASAGARSGNGSVLYIRDGGRSPSAQPSSQAYQRVAGACAAGDGANAGEPDGRKGPADFHSGPLGGRYARNSPFRLHAAPIG